MNPTECCNKLTSLVFIVFTCMPRVTILQELLSFSDDWSLKLMHYEHCFFSYDNSSGDSNVLN
jgi:hypothetical protein